MSESEAWRRVVVACVAAVCLMAILCCWMLRPARYQHIRSGAETAASKGWLLVFDRSRGELDLRDWDSDGGGD